MSIEVIDMGKFFLLKKDGIWLPGKYSDEICANYAIDKIGVSSLDSMIVMCSSDGIDVMKTSDIDLFSSL